MTPQHMAALHAAAFPASRGWSAAEFSDLLASPLCFWCGDDSAFALVRVVADEAELLTIATHPDHRRKGLARALMHAWHKDATARGARAAFLEVAEDNPGAIALYTSCGYAQTGRRPRYYPRHGSAAADALIFARNLTL